MIHIEDLCAEDDFPEKAKNLFVSDNSPTIYKIYRLFTGQIKLSCEDTLRTCNVQDNVIAAYYASKSDSFIETLSDYVIDVDDVDDVDRPEMFSKYFDNQKLSVRNKTYFQELFDEICSYQFAISKSNYVAAFIHEYRIIEYIAYACPLIYAVRSHDFYATFGHLQNFINNAGKGELGFFKTAIDKIFERDAIFPTTFDISLTGIPNGNIKESYSKVLSICLHSDWLGASSTEETFAIEFRNVGSALIELRNKIFHHSLNNPKNILASRLLDINHFMEIVTPTFFTWLGVIYLGVFKSILSFETTN